MPVPGPKYILPPLIGYEGHCVTKTRYPAHSVAFRTEIEFNSRTPAPKYNIGSYTRNGATTIPNAVVLSRPENEIQYNGKPGPKYAPNNFADPEHKTPPSAVIAFRTQPPRGGITPGPKYYVKGCIARQIEDLPNVPAWTILARKGDRLPTSINSPGPGKYPASDLNKFKRKAPEPVMGIRHLQPSKGIIPGPKYHGDFYNLCNRPPSWVLGIRHSPNETLLRTDEDNKPFYGF